MILLLGLVALLAYCINVTNRWWGALHSIRCYHGDEPDARRLADIAYEALHPNR